MALDIFLFASVYGWKKRRSALMSSAGERLGGRVAIPLSLLVEMSKIGLDIGRGRL
jgi:hypothetical protein